MNSAFLQGRSLNRSVQMVSPNLQRNWIGFTSSESLSQVHTLLLPPRGSTSTSALLTLQGATRGFCKHMQQSKLLRTQGNNFWINPLKGSFQTSAKTLEVTPAAFECHYTLQHAFHTGRPGVGATG